MVADKRYTILKIIQTERVVVKYCTFLFHKPIDCPPAKSPFNLCWYHSYDMKCLLLAFACAIAVNGASLNADPNEALTFAQALDRAGDASQQLHIDMEAHFDGLREEVSEHMTAISEAVLNTLLLAIETVDDRRLQPEQCDAQQGDEPADIDFVQLGSQLSRCALLGDVALQRLTNAFYEHLNGPQDRSLELLSLVLDYVGRANPLATAGELAAEILQSIDAMRTEFDGQTLPALRELVEAVAAGRVAVPEQTAECVRPVLEAVQC